MKGVASADALDPHAWKRKITEDVLTQVCLELLQEEQGIEWCVIWVFDLHHCLLGFG